MDSATRDAIEDFKQRVADLYGERLDQVILFGSQARGEATEASDVDLMVVLEGPVDRFAEIDRMGEATWKAVIEHDALLSVFPVSKENFQQGASPVIRTANRQGVPA